MTRVAPSPSPHPAVLSPRELADLTLRYAEAYRAGAYAVHYSADERWHRRIRRDARVDIWLISWLPTQATELHDHGMSAGAFTVVTGELTELQPIVIGEHAIALQSTVRRSPVTISFGADRVHDVLNRGDAPAVSVHAYSPPLTTMRYYRVSGSRLVVTRGAGVAHGGRRGAPS
jgi:hypothetical protein